MRMQWVLSQLPRENFPAVLTHRRGGSGSALQQSSAEVPEVTSGLSLPFVLKHLWVLVWSWPELEEIFVEVSYCPSGALAGCDDIPLKTLPRVWCGSMLLHPHPDWALFQQLVNDCPFLQSHIQPLVLKLW